MSARPAPAIKRSELAALPSLSSALSALPHAQGMHALALHEPTLSASARTPESEAKLRKALSVTSQNYANNKAAASVKPAPVPAQAQQQQQGGCPSPPPLMMRPLKNKMRT